MQFGFAELLEFCQKTNYSFHYLFLLLLRLYAFLLNGFCLAKLQTLFSKYNGLS